MRAITFHTRSFARVGDHVSSGHRSHCVDWPLGSALTGSQVVRIPGPQARPLDDGASVDAVRVRAFRPLWPAIRRVLPRLLPTLDGQVKQPIAVIHRLDAAPRRPVSLEDLGSLSQVTNDVHHAYPASNQEGFERVPGGRVPRHLPTHKVAVPGALFVRALAERGVTDVARMDKALTSAVVLASGVFCSGGVVLRGVTRSKPQLDSVRGQKERELLQDARP
jgi:hypothetical protein